MKPLVPRFKALEVFPPILRNAGWPDCSCKNCSGGRIFTVLNTIWSVLREIV